MIYFLWDSSMNNSVKRQFWLNVIIIIVCTFYKHKRYCGNVAIFVCTTLNISAWSILIPQLPIFNYKIICLLSERIINTSYSLYEIRDEWFSHQTVNYIKDDNENQNEQKCIIKNIFALKLVSFCKRSLACLLLLSSIRSSGDVIHSSSKYRD